jgi:hypothetical protein
MTCIQFVDMHGDMSEMLPVMIKYSYQMMTQVGLTSCQFRHVVTSAKRKLILTCSSAIRSISKWCSIVCMTKDEALAMSGNKIASQPIPKQAVEIQ